MNYDEMIFQLKDLKKDKEKYVDPDDPDDIVKKDIDALEIALNDLTYSNQLIKDNEYKNEMIKLYKQYVESLKDRIELLEERLKYRGDTNG